MIKDDSPLAKIEIIGLHGDRNISAKFSSPIKILVDENGAGKTTVLYVLVHLLKGNWGRLSKYSFKEICLTFRESLIKVSYDEIKATLEETPFIEQILARFPQHVVAEMIDTARRTTFSTWYRHHGEIAEHMALEMGYSTKRIFDLIEQSGSSTRTQLTHQRSFLFDKGLPNELDQKLQQIKEHFPFTILYFSTYRLVEENRYNIDVNRQTIPHRFIDTEVQYGMGMVQKRFATITDEIRRSAVEWYSKISGQMLGQLIMGLQSQSIDYTNILKPEALRIVLDRIGDNVSKNNKSTILSLVERQAIQQPEYVALAYFLSNLIKVYEQQQRKDEAIKAFVKVTNGYLNDKEIIYDESKLEIYPINVRTKRKIPLDKLSSGEKQIISIFSKLYLENPRPYAIFFDEPELSLSIEWQKKLLQDISNSDNCEFLLAATHSPFIFENDLAKFADVLHIEFVDSPREVEIDEEAFEENE